jgi:hypothetical protein
LECIATAAEEMAGTAIRPSRPADMLCDIFQIDRGIRHSRTTVRFDISVADVVTGEAIDVVGVLEVKRWVAVTVADVALVAALLVAGDSDTEIIQNVLFTYLADTLAFDVFDPLPVPVGRLHHLLMTLVMAGDARSRYLLWL